jgi:hypothetical protein
MKARSTTLFWMAVAGALAVAAPAIAQQSTGTPGPAGPTTTVEGRYLPPFPPPFTGHIGREAKDSTPDFPQPVRAPRGAPSILLILTDDVGFSASSAFGGAVPTPKSSDTFAEVLRQNGYNTADQGWDKLREETFARQRQMGIIPATTKLTPRPKEIQAWDTLDANRKKVLRPHD